MLRCVVPERLLAVVLALVGPFMLVAEPVGAQQRPPVSRADSIARADSIQRADSIAIVRELEAAAAAQQGPSGQAPRQGAANPRLLPDISAVGDLIADLSPKGSTMEDGTRFGIREVEIALQAAVDPTFRGDVFIGFSDAEGVAIEQAFLTASALPFGLEARLGRFLMPVGKENTTHRHDLHTIEYSHVTQRFFGEEGLKGTGVSLSKVLAPFGFYQELLVTAVDAFGGGHGHEEEEEPEPEPAEPANKDLDGLGYSARFRNYWDLSQAANIELAFSGVTGKRAQPVEVIVCCSDATGVNARQSVIGADFTYRWRPLQQGLFKSFLFRVEVMRQLNERDPDLGDLAGTHVYSGPTRAFDGAYLFARYQLARRWFLGARADWLEDPEADGETLRAGSGYIQFYPSEFSKLVAGFEHLRPGAGEDRINRLILQATFALGPHKPHPF